MNTALIVPIVLSFPGQIRQASLNWIVGPLAVIGNREARIVQGKKASGAPIKRYFDEESGLLVRVVRYSSGSPVGRVPTQVDFEGLPGRVRNQVRVQVDLDVDGWTDGPSAEERPDQPRDSCGTIREAGTARTACGALILHPANQRQLGRLGSNDEIDLAVQDLEQREHLID